MGFEVVSSAEEIDAVLPVVFHFAGWYSTSMASLPQQPFVTPEEYLEADRKAEGRSEYVDGQVYAMSGTSKDHNRVTRNIWRALEDELGDDGSCEVFGIDIRVSPETRRKYFYPDIVVVCGEARHEDEAADTVLNPKLVVEVLSPSTELYDRGLKFAHYRKSDSLAEYLVVAQQEIFIEHYVREADGAWRISEINDPNATIDLPSINAKLKVSDIYRRVKFDR
jgi:Uma2 family endonuclease